MKTMVLLNAIALHLHSNIQFNVIDISKMCALHSRWTVCDHKDFLLSFVLNVLVMRCTEKKHSVRFA